MYFYGIKKVFSTKGSEQYNAIGAFWDEMAQKYGISNLRGLGYNWQEDSIEYVIGLIDGIIDDYNCVEELPDTGWINIKGETNKLDKLYDDIYKDGRLDYEIEKFNEDGTCEISYYRKN